MIFILFTSNGEVVLTLYTNRALSVVLSNNNIFPLIFFNCNPISDLSCIMGRCVCIMASGEIMYYYSDSVLPCQSSRKRTASGGRSCFSFHSTLCQFTFDVLGARQGGFTLTALNMNLLSGLRELYLSSRKVYDISPSVLSSDSSSFKSSLRKDTLLSVVSF